VVKAISNVVGAIAGVVEAIASVVGAIADEDVVNTDQIYTPWQWR
jgi:hypothetical protein